LQKDASRPLLFAYFRKANPDFCGELELWLGENWAGRKLVLE